MTTNPTPSFAGALTSLRTSTALLTSSISILEAGVSDLPRLTRVLAQTRHFELIPASTLQSAQAALLDELAPEVQRLLSRVEAEVERLERRERSLRARWELQEGRLGREEEKKPAYGGGVAAGAGPSTKPQAVGGMKAQQLRMKKDRLSYAVERLQMQAQQTERKLRMSMAAQEELQAQDEQGGHSAEDEDDF